MTADQVRSTCFPSIDERIPRRNPEEMAGRKPSDEMVGIGPLGLT